MSFAAITLCVASQLVFIVVSVYFVIDSVRKLLGYTLVCSWIDYILSIMRSLYGVQRAYKMSN
jgi:hypothetical protein